jgi:hypothetical protein
LPARAFDAFRRRGFERANDGTERRAWRRVVCHHDNAVKMVGHDDPFIQGNREMPGNRFPAIGDHAPRFIQPHFQIDDRTKRADAAVRAHGHEIRARLTVIISFRRSGRRT